MKELDRLLKLKFSKKQGFKFLNEAYRNLFGIKEVDWSDEAKKKIAEEMVVQYYRKIPKELQ